MKPQNKRDAKGSQKSTKSDQASMTPKVKQSKQREITGNPQNDPETKRIATHENKHPTTLKSSK
jgi:hypothetical protein